MIGSTHLGLGMDVWQLRYKIGYLITALLFSPVFPVHPAFRICPDTIRISWVSTFHFVDISIYCGYRGYVRILWI